MESSLNLKENKEEIASIHNFKDKLLQPSLINVLKEYVLWQANIRNATNPEDFIDKSPDMGPISINLDLTTACNYACDHCIDMDILNKGINHDDDELFKSLDDMHKKGLKSVILIGGGEPTLHPKFGEVVTFLKERDIKVAIVSNGSNVHKFKEVGHLFTEKDWIRLSLDSGTDETFQAMHKSRKKITLNQICKNVLELKKEYPNIRIGFSYIVTWKDATINNVTIISNIHELILATKLSKDHGFNYISIKPFLERAPENNAEIVGISKAAENYENTIKSIRESVKEAKKLEDNNFKVIESTNLRVMEGDNWEDYTIQPKNCHMTFFRQVLSPLGIFICPAHRSVDKATISKDNLYVPEKRKDAMKKMADRILNFDASHECRKITCLYNSVNWFVEDLIERARIDPESIRNLQPSEERNDYYL